jgi:hypothetical protein
MRPTPHLGTTDISPPFKADAVNVAVSASKDSKLRVVFMSSRAPSSPWKRPHCDRFRSPLWFSSERVCDGLVARDRLRAAAFHREARHLPRAHCAWHGRSRPAPAAAGYAGGDEV